MPTVSDRDQSLIDHIEAVRSRNNRHWMDLVRLAFRTAPTEARELLSQITECDEQVQRLTKELASE